MAKNYLNNYDMLREIHLSKNSYCSFKNIEKDNKYDIILPNVDEIHKNILSAQLSRASRLSKDLQEDIIPTAIPITDLVFRITSWDHIPSAPSKKVKQSKKSKALKLIEDIDPELEDIDPEIEKILMTQPDPSHVRLNFPPFLHYRLNKVNKPVLVGKSHWVGDFKKGHFSKTHGQLTDELCMMMMKLCDRYGSKGNWRYYTYNDEMRGSALVQLIQVGLQFDESKGNNPFAYFSQIINNSFCRILNIEKKNQDIRDDILEANGMMPSYTRQESWHKE
jgi:hypothetical protein